MKRRHLLAVAPALLLPFSAAAQDSPLRVELDRAWTDWRLAMMSKETAKWAATTCRYRQMCLRNEIVSMRMQWPGALFNLIFTAPDTRGLQFIDATAQGDTARLVYFGQVDIGLEYGAVKPMNPLVIHFLKDDGAWKFNTLQYVNLNLDEETKTEVRNGGRKWLEGPEFKLTGVYPPIPRPCPEPYAVSTASIMATDCTLKVDVNAGQWVETLSDNTANRVVIGGLRKGLNQAVLTVKTIGTKPAAAIRFFTKTNGKMVMLTEWKLPEGPLQAEYRVPLVVKSSVVVR